MQLRDYIENTASSSSPVLSAQHATPKRGLIRSFLNTWTLPYLYLVVALTTVLVLSLTVPPMQALDENRHFIRAVQFSQGGWIPQLETRTNRAGGYLPQAVFEFASRTMSPDFLQGEQSLHTIR